MGEARLGSVSVYVPVYAVGPVGSARVDVCVRSPMPSQSALFRAGKEGCEISAVSCALPSRGVTPHARLLAPKKAREAFKHSARAKRHDHPVSRCWANRGKM